MANPRKLGLCLNDQFQQANSLCCRLLNEFLKEHSKVEALQASFTQQQKDYQATAAHQQQQIEALTAGLQKVSNQLELSKPAPRTVLNDQ